MRSVHHIVLLIYMAVFLVLGLIGIGYRQMLTTHSYFVVYDVPAPKDVTNPKRSIKVNHIDAPTATAAYAEAKRLAVNEYLTKHDRWLALLDKARKNPTDLVAPIEAAYCKAEMDAKPSFLAIEHLSTTSDAEIEELIKEKFRTPTLLESAGKDRCIIITHLEKLD